MSSKTEGATDATVREAMTVTIKYGKGYEESWAVFRGDVWQIRADLITYFGINVDYANGVTLNELVIAATHVAHGTGNVAAVLGATPISVTESLTGAPTGNAAWDQFDGKGEKPAVEAVREAAEGSQALISQLQQAASVADLKKLWAEHQAAFSDASVKAAYSVRGKALKAAEKAAA